MRTRKCTLASALDWPSSCFLEWSRIQMYAPPKTFLTAGMANSLPIQALETIFLLYVTPETSDNLELRQCLSYFFPVYCYSNAENQRKVKEAS
jgi:hypothetical protein